MIIVLWIIIFIIVLIIGWWVIGVYNITNPLPIRPDGNFQQLINDYDSFPKELWYRNNKCVFDEYLKCSHRRYVILESNGDVIYDSKPCDPLYPQRAESIPRSVEYQRATSNLIGSSIRHNTNFLCVAAVEGNRWRIIHISEYVFNENDPCY